MKLRQKTKVQRQKFKTWYIWCEVCDKVSCWVAEADTPSLSVQQEVVYYQHYRELTQNQVSFFIVDEYFIKIINMTKYFYTFVFKDIHGFFLFLFVTATG
jgi:hypothetical protein